MTGKSSWREATIQASRLIGIRQTSDDPDALSDPDPVGHKAPIDERALSSNAPNHGSSACIRRNAARSRYRPGGYAHCRLHPRRRSSVRQSIDPPRAKLEGFEHVHELHSDPR